MVTTLAESELYAAVAHWITANNEDVGYRMLVDFPALGHTSVDNKIEWRGTPSILPTEQNLIDAYNAHLVAATAQQTVTSIQEGAKAQAASIPNWATWTNEEVLAWFDANITAGLPAANLAAANVVLSNMATAQRAMARMLVALRNNAWADMQGE